MTLTSRLANLFRSEKRSTDGDPYWGQFAALQTGPVNSRTAQGISAVYGCVAAISETVASLPLILFC